MHPAKTRISLGIQPGQTSLSAWRNLGSIDSQWAHIEYTNQTGWMPRLIWVFAGRTCHCVGFDAWRLKWQNLHWGPKNHRQSSKGTCMSQGREKHMVRPGPEPGTSRRPCEHSVNWATEPNGARSGCEHNKSHVMKKTVFAIWEQQRRRSVDAQSDQRISVFVIVLYLYLLYPKFLATT